MASAPTLLTALSVYDRNDIGSGIAFAHQTGLCTLGMEGVEAGAKLLQTWWCAEKIDSKNLALRAFVFNQQSVADALARLQDTLKTQNTRGDELAFFETIVSLGKELGYQFDRVFGFLDLITPHGHVNAAGALSWLGQLGREVLRSGAPGPLDRAIHWRLSTYLTASLGSQAVDLRLAEHRQAGTSADRERIARPVTRRLDQAFVTHLNNAHTNQFYRVRLASGLLVLEAAILLAQGRRDDMGRRFASEVFAGAMVTFAAAMELLAVGTEQALAEVGKKSLTARGAEISLGNYRIWGAALASAGATVSIWWDIQDALKSSKSERPNSRDFNFLPIGYGARVAGTVALLTGQLGIAFSQAGPLFRYLALGTNNSMLRGVSTALAELAAKLAANRAVMLLLSRTLAIAGMIVIVATIVLIILDSDAFEKWCVRCCFGLAEGADKYASSERELSALFHAIREVV